MKNLDYKEKYLRIKAKFIKYVDQSFRNGYEIGAKEAEMEFLQQKVAETEQANAMMEEEAAGFASTPGEEGNPMGGGGDAQMGEAGMMEDTGVSEGGDSDDMNLLMDELGAMVAKGEKPKIVDIRNKVFEIKGILTPTPDTKVIEKSEKDLEIDGLLDGMANLDKAETEADSSTRGIDINEVNKAIEDVQVLLKGEDSEDDQE